MSYTPAGIQALVDAVDRGEALARASAMNDIRTAMHADKGEFEKAIHRLTKARHG